MRRRNSYRSTVARLLLLVQLFMLTNAVVFRHAHRLPDGTIVVHAHPFLPKANGPVQPNDHTRQELVWLDAITDVCYPFTEPAFFVFQAPGAMLVPAPAYAEPELGYWAAFTCFLHRGPPVI